MRKYCALANLTEDQLKVLFTFRPAIIGKPVSVHGAKFNFFYSLHTIPCMGFECKYEGKSIYFSGDTFYDPERLK